MGYRSLKRVLGETSLERKCRILFGAALLLLIAGAFWWVEYSARRMIESTMQRKGRDMVGLSLMTHHFQWWHDAVPVEYQGENAGHAALLHETIKTLSPSGFRYEFLTLEGADDQYIDLEKHVPTDPWEQQLLLRLQQELRTRLAEQRHTRPPAGPSATKDTASPVPQAFQPGADELVVAADRPVPENNEYSYYQVVTWNHRCFSCHTRLQDLGAVPAAELAGLEERGPFTVVKVVMPWNQAREAITRARAGLITAGIATVFVAMIALWVIVRYVIVKPLRHLRDVSDEISRGHLDLRAEVHTNDEFEELAASFNRMLRHLTDAQAELRQVNADLDAKVDQLAQLNMRLYEMNRLKGDFLANMSHELRTPLNSIIGFSEVLQGIDALNDKQKRYAQNIQKSGRLLLEMINDILDLAKMESGKMEVRPSEFQIEALFVAQCEMVRSLTEDKNIDLECRVPKDLPPVYQDQSKVQQILTNLLSNAIKFTPEGGRITVSAQRDSRERLVMKVEDTGVGIPEEDREIIFEKFRQSGSVLGRDGLTREYSGTGLGLSIVKELCRLLGGEISVESEVGKGSCFTVVLPWSLADRSRREAEINSRLDELSRPTGRNLPSPV